MMKKTLLVLLLCLSVNLFCIAEEPVPSSADVFLDNLSKTWNSFLVMADDAGKDVSKWAQESGVADWAEETAKGIEAWADENGITAWSQEALNNLTKWSEESGFNQWTQDTAAQFQKLVDENRPAVEAWLQSAGEEATKAWNTLMNPKGHTEAELDQALQTVVESLEVSEGSDATGSIENGEFVVRIPVSENDLGWYADDMVASVSVNLKKSEIADGMFIARYAPAKDGDAVISVRHYYNACACDQAHTFNVTVQDGVILDTTGGSYTASPDDAELDSNIIGDWQQTDANGSEMTIDNNENRGWDVEVITPASHGAYVFKATVYYDCWRNAFVYDKGKFWEVPISDSDDTELGKPIVVGAAGWFAFDGENQDDLRLIWVNDQSTEENRVFERK